MHWLLKGFLAGLALFVLWQGWHYLSGTPFTPLHIAVDVAQWMFAGFGIGIYFRSRELVAAQRRKDDQ